MQKNSIIDVYSYLYDALHDSKKEIFFISFDSFETKNNLYNYVPEASANYLGVLISDVFIEQAKHASSNFAHIIIPTLLGNKSDGSLSGWKCVLNNIEVLVNQFNPVDGLIIGEYVSEFERTNGRVEIFQENSLLYLNLVSGSEVYDELIKRNIKDARPLIELQEYKIITLPKHFQDYLEQNKLLI